MDAFIRWKKGDYIRLGQAVSRFNKLIKSLEVDERDYLPDLKEYQDLKNHITSRKELNRIIRSLKRADARNLLEKKVYESGEEVSRWEYGEINKALRRASINLNKEKENILSTRPSIGMGDERISEINAIERSFKTLPLKTGGDFKRLVERIMHVGRSDYTLSKAEQFRKNYYVALDGLKNFRNYELLKKKLDKIKNPLAFYEYVKKSPTLMDIFLWYKTPEVNIYGSFRNNEEAVDFGMLYDLDIIETET